MINSACFIGHRKINNTHELRKKIKDVLQDLIKNGTVNFLFGDRSEFDSLCYEIVSELKDKHPEIVRIYFRKNYENAGEYTMQYLLCGFEEGICPKGIGNAGKASYIERNKAMIEESDICIFYYDENYIPPKIKKSHNDILDFQPKSGTAIAYAFALQKNKNIINMCDTVK